MSNTDRKRTCYNCDHHRDIYHCDLDGHYIGYLDCFEGWCKHWKKGKLRGRDNEKD